LHVKFRETLFTAGAEEINLLCRRLHRSHK
jgi:hypothetical protein